MHLATSYPSKYLKWIKFIKEKLNKKVIISADAVDSKDKDTIDQMVEVFRKVDLIFINTEELNNIKQAYRNIKFNKPMVLKKGKYGAVYINKFNKVIVRVPALKVDVKDSTAAGDVLAGVFLAKLAIGYNIYDSLKHAVRVSSESVRDFGVDHLSQI